MIKFEKQDEVDSLEPYVTRVLEALGYPGAFVTDSSTIMDFGCFSDRIEHQLTTVIRRQLGLRVTANETIVSVAKKLRKATLKSQ